MAISFMKLLSNAKTRTLVLLTGGLLFSGILIAILSSGKTGGPTENRPSKTTQVPKGVESTPGAKTSEKYRELQEKANVIGATKAEKKGGTFIPTIVAENKDKNKDEDLQSQFLKALGQQSELNKSLKEQQDQAQAALQNNPKLAQLLAQQKLDDAATEALNKQRLAQVNAEKMAAINEQRVKAVETVAQAMDEQTKTALAAWKEVPTQAFTEGELKIKKQSDGESSNQRTGNSKVDTRPVILKAGSILFAVLETAVNSDEPGPIMARIIQPPFKDAKLIGKMEVPSGEGEKITLRFDTMSMPAETNSNKLDAVAIDPDTARTALASKVDHHYFLRWGTLLGSSFITGYAQAVAKSGTTVVSNTGLVGTSTTTQTPALSGKQQIYEGLGQVGAKLGDVLGQQFSRKPTITITSGTSIGILVLSDVKLGPEPTKEAATKLTNSNTTSQKTSNPMDLLNTIIQSASQVNNTRQQQTTNANETN